MWYGPQDRLEARTQSHPRSGTGNDGSKSLRFSCVCAYDACVFDDCLIASMERDTLVSVINKINIKLVLAPHFIIFLSPAD